MIAALEKSLGIVTIACKEAGISRTLHYNWYNEDAEYKQAVDDVADIALDFVESKLYKKIEADDTTAMIFYLKTKGKKRGYIVRTEHEFSGSVVLPITGMQIVKDDTET